MHVVESILLLLVLLVLLVEDVVVLVRELKVLGRENGWVAVDIH